MNMCPTTFNIARCPQCQHFIKIPNFIKENTWIYCFYCETYFNYKTNSSITTLRKEVNRGRHDKD